MASAVIQAEGLGKRYKIGQPQHSRALRDVLAKAWSAPFRKTQQRNGSDILWALKSVSFTIQQGQSVAIIGRNGSGKSTLLKILSRITEPTEGHADIRGRVGSLLEVGTGFHSELTGRENVYLNGAILGMTKREINRKFDEIVAFSEIERFLDTPVKHYSSGMYVRLAFAVAAHMDPEILLVDEVLAVGDVTFQKKCLGKMDDVAKSGRTVLFVSHNTHAVSQLCSRAIWLDNGRVKAIGSTAQVLSSYLARDGRAAEVCWEFGQAPGSDVARLRAMRVLNAASETAFTVQMNEPLRLQAEFWLMRQSRIHVSFHVYNQYGVLLFATGNFHDPEWHNRQHQPGLYACTSEIPRHYLNEGRHRVTVYLTRERITDAIVEDAVSFDVHDPGDTRCGWTGIWVGAVRPILPWTGQRIGDVP